MNRTLKLTYLCLGLMVSCGVFILSGCQSPESGGQLTGFSNPLSGVPSQSEPPISTLGPVAEEAGEPEMVESSGDSDTTLE